MTEGPEGPFFMPAPTFNGGGMKIALVGGAPSSQMLAPFDDEGQEIWVLGNQLKDYSGKRVTRIFEIHDDLATQHPQYAERLAGLGIPLVVGEKFPIKADHIKVFPFGEARKFFGRDYLTSSAAYMMALALIERATEVALYGFDMAVDDAEYFHQRDCLHAWIGLAMGRGVKVAIPSVSPILKSHYIEGKTTRSTCGPFTHGALADRANQHRAKANELRGTALQHDGCAEAYEKMAQLARAVESGLDVQSLDHGVKMR